jgi:hypothetical protein
MNAIGFPELLVITMIGVFWVIPVAAGVWALFTLHRIHTGQQALHAKLDTIERLLQGS